MEAKRKLRKDAWWSDLSEDLRWRIFDETRSMPWQDAVARAAELTGVPAPSRSMWYRYEKAMRSEAMARRVELAAQARAEAGRLADAAGAVGETAKAFLSMATEIAMRTGSAADAEAWTRMATQLYTAAAQNRGLAIRAEAARLARDKFNAAEQRLKEIRETVAAAKGTDGGLSAEALAKIEQAASLL